MRVLRIRRWGERYLFDVVGYDPASVSGPERIPDMDAGQAMRFLTEQAARGPVVIRSGEERVSVPPGNLHHTGVPDVVKFDRDHNAKDWLCD